MPENPLPDNDFVDTFNPLLTYRQGLGTRDHSGSVWVISIIRTYE